MKLKEWALVSEIVGAIAIVVSLIFVGLQVRQSADETALNTSAVKAEAYQSLVGYLLEFDSDMYTYEHIAELSIRKNTGQGEPLTRVEERQYERTLAYLLELGDLAYYQYLQGVLDRERLDNIVGNLIAQSRTRGFREAWDKYDFKNRVHPEFAAYIEEHGLQADEWIVPQ